MSFKMKQVTATTNGDGYINYDNEGENFTNVMACGNIPQEAPNNVASVTVSQTGSDTCKIRITNNSGPVANKQVSVTLLFDLS
jgi:hypothetical protein